MLVGSPKTCCECLYWKEFVNPTGKGVCLLILSDLVTSSGKEIVDACDPITSDSDLCSEFD